MNDETQRPDPLRFRERLDSLNFTRPVPDDLQSDIRMAFNEAIAGGPNINGDGGPTLSINHAYDCAEAVVRIQSLEQSVKQLTKSIQDAISAGQLIRPICSLLRRTTGSPVTVKVNKIKPAYAAGQQ